MLTAFPEIIKISSLRQITAYKKQQPAGFPLSYPIPLATPFTFQANIVILT
jgi:hypothetical protein